MLGKLDISALKDLMRRRGVFSYTELANIAGLHRNSLLPYLSGSRSGYTTTLLAISKALDVLPETLLQRHAAIDPFQVFPIIEKLLAEFKSQHAEMVFFLFGSRSSGKAERYSDYDVGCSAGINKIPTRLFLEMKQSLSILADDLPVKVDLVNFDNAPIWFFEQLKLPLIYLCGERNSLSYLLGRINATKEASQSSRIA